MVALTEDEGGGGGGGVHGIELPVDEYLHNPLHDVSIKIIKINAFFYVRIFLDQYPWLSKYSHHASSKLALIDHASVNLHQTVGDFVFMSVRQLFAILSMKTNNRVGVGCEAMADSLTYWSSGKAAWELQK